MRRACTPTSSARVSRVALADLGSAAKAAGLSVHSCMSPVTCTAALLFTTSNVGMQSVPLQEPSSESGPIQGRPPYAAAGAPWRFRMLRPWPHGLLHSDQAPQEPQRQSTGQSSFAQASTSRRSPLHSAPPCASGTVAFRRRSAMPPPQVFEHALQFPQGLHWQSTGHGSTLHGLWSIAPPTHSRPPARATWVVTRFLVAVPFPPQLMLQADHSLQSDHWQSKGQSWFLHASSCCCFSLQGPPAPFVLPVKCRWRSFEPSPQVLEHEPQLSHGVQTQSLGHV